MSQAPQAGRNRKHQDGGRRDYRERDQDGGRRDRDVRDGKKEGGQPQRRPQPTSNVGPREPAGNSFLHERLVYIAMNLVGRTVQVVVKNGDVYEGIFHACSPEKEMGMVLCMARKKGGLQEKVQAPIKTLVVHSRDMLQLIAKDVEMSTEEEHKEQKEDKKTKNLGEVVADTDISSGSMGQERDLVQWADQPARDTTWDPTASAGGMNEAWDQFAVNERLFGVTTTFQEEIYTTKLDRTKISAEAEARASRLAAEIEKGDTSNVHLMEERGQAGQGGDEELDEESKYSTVLGTDRDNNPDEINIQLKEERAKASKAAPAKNPWKNNGKKEEDASKAAEPAPKAAAIPSEEATTPAPAVATPPVSATSAPTPTAPPASAPASTPVTSSLTAPKASSKLNANAKVFVPGGFSTPAAPVAAASPYTYPPSSAPIMPGMMPQQGMMPQGMGQRPPPRPPMVQGQQMPPYMGQQGYTVPNVMYPGVRPYPTGADGSMQPGMDPSMYRQIPPTMPGYPPNAQYPSMAQYPARPPAPNRPGPPIHHQQGMMPQQMPMGPGGAVPTTTSMPQGYPAQMPGQAPNMIRPMPYSTPPPQ